MPENPRTRDSIILVKGDAFPVAIDPTLAAQGWQGGSGVQWTTPVAIGQATVTRSDGYYAGFALWGSDESSDQYTAMTRQFPTYHYLIFGAGGWLIQTISFEEYTYASRIGPGPLVPLTYKASDRLVFSLRGFWTIEDEWTLSGDPRAPNNYFIGFVSQAPTTQTDGYMTVQVSILPTCQRSSAPATALCSSTGTVKRFLWMPLCLQGVGLEGRAFSGLMQRQISGW